MSQRHAWLAWFPLWDAMFILGFLGSAVFVYQAAPDSTDVNRPLALTLIVSQIGWYVSIGRDVIRQDQYGRGNVLFAGLVATTFAGACSAAPLSSISLVAVIPLMFWSLRPFPALAVVSVLILVPGVLEAVRVGSVQAALLDQGPLAFTLIAFPAVVGFWISSIIQQSQERAALITDLADTREELARTAEQAGITSERNRLAGDIHDAVAQSLNSIVMLAQAVSHALEHQPAEVRERTREQVKLIESTAREAWVETTVLVDELKPPVLQGDTLGGALTRVTRRFEGATGVAAESRIVGDQVALPVQVEVTMLRITQEALANIAKHAQATRIDVVLRFTPEAVAIEIADDGTGFDVAKPSIGHGLGGMRERVDACGGEFRVTSTRSGTQLLASVPLPAEAADA